MPKMECKKCNSELTDEEAKLYYGFCKNCYTQNEKERKKETIILIVVIIVCICLILGGLLFNNLVLIPFNEYSEAKKWLEEYSTSDLKEVKDYEKYVKYFEDNIEYKDNMNNLSKIKYSKATKLIDYQAYSYAIQILDDITEYKDSQELLYSCKYNLAIQKYSSGEFHDAKTLFEQLDGYNDTNDYLKKLELLLPLQGRYEYYINYIYILRGWNFYIIHSPETTNQINFSYLYEIDGNTIKVYSNSNSEWKGYNFEIVDGNLRDTSSDVIYVHKSTSTTLPKKANRVIFKEPSIGMTKTEAENSTWGKPKKINKTTTAYGTHEQWVYDGYKYLYFDNGKLTSIQE